MRQGRYADAERVLERAWSGRSRVEGEEHPRILGTLAALGKLFAARERYAQAESTYLQVIDVFGRTAGLGDPVAQRTIRDLVELYEQLGQPREATRWLARILTSPG